MRSTTSDIYRSIAAAQPLAAGEFRVVVSGSGAQPACHDCKTLADAKAYADDVAAEAEDEPQLAYVYDSSFFRVYEGRPYYVK